MVGAIAAACWLTALCVHDLRSRRLPNLLTLPGAAAVLAVATIDGRGTAALAGAAGLAALYLVVHLAAPAGMGAGDVKLALGVGALSGWCGADAWLLAALLAPVLTAVAGLLLRRPALPHGPSMCLATAGAIALALA